jgi:hypothetical protein
VFVRAWSISGTGGIVLVRARSSSGGKAWLPSGSSGGGGGAPQRPMETG